MSLNFSRGIAASLCLTAFAACGSLGSSGSYEATPSELSSASINRFFEEVFLARLDRSPQLRDSLGVPGDRSVWDDVTDEHRRETVAMAERDLERMRAEFDLDDLDAGSQLSFRMFEFDAEHRMDEFPWRFHSYPINQMFGLHSQLPSHLINKHGLKTVADAQDYITRLDGIAGVVDDQIADLDARQQRGILPPKFVYPMVMNDCRNLLKGRPFDESGEDSTLLADFRGKLEALDSLSLSDRNELLDHAISALAAGVGPAYERLIAKLAEQEAVATLDDGVWKLPDGDNYYAACLRRHTTTDLSADQIHAIGLSEVERIHGEMRAIMTAVEHDGDLASFFEFMRTDQRFYYPGTAEGRAEYLARASEMLDVMTARLDELFITKPKAPMIVKAVEAYRERSAGKAFYEAGAPDGSRPGTYYANLYRMEDMPTYQMEALAYHEGTPGHHMQNSIARELTGIPRFRRYEHYTVYGEGWALYTEYLPKELGFYADPYSDFGRLAMELWRACRLVVDTGIHNKRWTREQAIEYLMTNTPNPEGDCTKAIERYIVMPGQATAYKIGMLKILELREKAKQTLGDSFDIRGFHETVLVNGPVPLNILEELVDQWVAKRRK
jgi:uncharacterized protein (DUF885 family)